jgi:hypothetical protein
MPGMVSILDNYAGPKAVIARHSDKISEKLLMREYSAVLFRWADCGRSNHEGRHKANHNSSIGKPLICPVRHEEV